MSRPRTADPDNYSYHSYNTEAHAGPVEDNVSRDSGSSAVLFPSLSDMILGHSSAGTPEFAKRGMMMMAPGQFHRSESCRYDSEWMRQQRVRRPQSDSVSLYDSRPGVRRSWTGPEPTVKPVILPRWVRIMIKLFLFNAVILLGNP